MFNINDLKNKSIRKENHHKEIYSNILKKCHNRIIYSSNELNSQYILYKIPNIIFGCPIFNKKECSKFLIQNLIKNGFKIKYLGDGFIFISWKHIYEDKNIKNNQPKLIKDKKILNFRSIEDVPKSEHFFL